MLQNGNKNSNYRTNLCGKIADFLDERGGKEYVNYVTIRGGEMRREPGDLFSADRDRASLLPEMGMPVPVKGRDI